MRYFGKEGPQCTISLRQECQEIGRCRQVARGVLFGRVPRFIIRCLGIFLVSMVLYSAVWSLFGLGDKAPRTSAMDSAIILKR